MLLDRLQYPGRTDDCRVQQVLFRVRDIEVERTGCVDHDFERWVGLHGLVESTRVGNVLDYHVAELALWNILVIVEDCLAFLRSANGCDDRVVPF